MADMQFPGNLRMSQFTGVAKLDSDLASTSQRCSAVLAARALADVDGMESPAYQTNFSHCDGFPSEFTELN